ncbi:phosphate starvation-inducible protein PhoH [bacterium]|nr:phosphate starvation-inducible protein PhoH [bacterium]
MQQNRKKRQGHFKKKELKPKTENQFDYIRTIVESDVTLCYGPPGTGKTAVAVGIACEHLLSNRVKKIIITRPVIESGRGLGFLPGTFDEKIHPYLIPVLEEMNSRLGENKIKDFKAKGLIEVCPLEYMRGRNFHNSFMILDEAQNCTMEQIKMFMTRIGFDSKAVINGDIDQTDLPPHLRGALQECVNKLDGVERVGVVALTEKDIIRNKIISKILGALGN